MCHAIDDVCRDIPSMMYHVHLPIIRTVSLLVWKGRLSPSRQDRTRTVSLATLILRVVPGMHDERQVFHVSALLCCRARREVRLRVFAT